MSKQEAIETAIHDLAERIGVQRTAIRCRVDDAEFPDMALGAAQDDEMSGQMITPGWRITLTADGSEHEYRANEHQLRLYDFKGRNLRIK